MFVSVSPLCPLPAQLPELDYALPQSLDVQSGDLVCVPFHSREILALVKNVMPTSAVKKYKEVTSIVVKDFCTKADLIRLQHLATPLETHEGHLLSLCLPKEATLRALTASLKTPHKLPGVSKEAVADVQEILRSESSITKWSADIERTLILIHALRKKTEKQILVIVPDEHTAKSIGGLLHLGTSAHILTGASDPRDRLAIAKAWREGEITSLITTLMGSILPPHDLEAIVVVEAGSPELTRHRRAPHLDARNAGLALQEQSGAKLFLCDPLPRLEDAPTAPLTLTTNPEEGPHIINLTRTEEHAKLHPLLSPTLVEEIKRALLSQKNAVLFLNKKGVASRLFCTSCLNAPVCGVCGQLPDIRLEDLKCPRCHAEMWLPETCPHCGKKTLKKTGLGTASLEKTLRGLFPGTPIIRYEKGHARDTSQSGGLSIILGTDYLFQTFFTPFARHNLGLIADVAFDLSLTDASFRASEQASRRLRKILFLAENEHAPYLVQTYLPDAVRTLSNLPDFILEETQVRQKYSLPPYVTSPSS